VFLARHIGYRNFKAVLSRAISIAMPELSVSLSNHDADDDDPLAERDEPRDDQAQPQHCKRSFFQSNDFSSKVWNASLSCDCAIMQMRRNRYSPGDCVRFLWSDSSPVREYDWFWCQADEVRKVDLISVFEASIMLELAIADYSRQTSARMAEHGFLRSIGGITSFGGWFAKMQYSLLDEWKPHLRTLRSKVQQYIYPPVNASSGQKGTSHTTTTSSPHFSPHPTVPTPSPQAHRLHQVLCSASVPLVLCPD